MTQPPDSAAAAINPRKATPVHTMTDGDLADEHRGQTFAKERAAQRIEMIEAELDRRGVTEAKGKLGAVKRHASPGLLDLPKLRAEHAELTGRYVRPGTNRFWRSRTLGAEEKR